VRNELKADSPNIHASQFSQIKTASESDRGGRTPTDGGRGLAAGDRSPRRGGEKNTGGAAGAAGAPFPAAPPSPRKAGGATAAGGGRRADDAVFSLYRVAPCQPVKI
jgi:hypothetical protein